MWPALQHFIFPIPWKTPLFSKLSNTIRRLAAAVLRRDSDALAQQSSVPRLPISADSMDPSCLDRLHAIQPSIYLSRSPTAPELKGVSGRPDYWRRELGPLRFLRAACRMSRSRRRVSPPTILVGSKEYVAWG